MMGDWHLLGSILEEVHIHSNIVGKIWLTILFIFRMLVLGVAAENVWNDEQSEFVCNTEQPGCKNVCYDQAFPISLIRYWVLQVIFVSAPSLVYMGHALYRLRALEKERHRRKACLKAELEGRDPIQEDHKRIERELRKLDEQRKVKKAPLRGSLLRTYVFHILTRSLVEVGFIIGQCALYGIGLSPLYKCERFPCPNSVDCFVSRPTEKNIFMVFMLVIAGISLFLNLLEIFHLGIRKIERSLFVYNYGDDDSVCRSKKNSMVQQVCVLSNSPQGTMQLSQTACVVVPDGQEDPFTLFVPSAAPHNQQGSCADDAPNVSDPQPRRQRLPSQADAQGFQQLGAVERRYTLTNRNHSCSSEDSNGPRSSGLVWHGGARPTPLAGHAEIPAALRNPLRKQSRVSACKDFSDTSDSPDSGHYPIVRKASFMSRGQASPPDSGGSQSGADTASQCLAQGESPDMTTPPPPVGGRRMSMSMILELSSIMKK